MVPFLARIFVTIPWGDVPSQPPQELIDVASAVPGQPPRELVDAADAVEYCPKDCHGEFKHKGQRRFACSRARKGEVNIIVYGHPWEPILDDREKHISFCPVNCTIRYRSWCDADKANIPPVNALQTNEWLQMAPSASP